MAVRGLTSVDFVIHGGRTFVFSDLVDDDGNVLPLGVDALKAFKAKKQLVLHNDSAVEGEMTVIIPYHAVMEYEVSKNMEDVEKPADDFCQTDPCLAEGTCNTSWTITFANGDTKLAEYLVKNGETPVYGGATPTMTQEGYTCEFIGWNTDKTAQTALDELPPATAVATYYAIFTCTQN